MLVGHKAYFLTLTGGQACSMSTKTAEFWRSYRALLNLLCGFVWSVIRSSFGEFCVPILCCWWY